MGGSGSSGFLNKRRGRSRGGRCEICERGRKGNVIGRGLGGGGGRKNACPKPRERKEKEGTK